MTKVTMIQTAPGSPDGCSVKQYHEGMSYDLPDALAKVFVEEMSVGLYTSDNEVETPEDEMQEVEKPVAAVRRTTKRTTRRSPVRRGS